jgi:hypothetical protein
MLSLQPPPLHGASNQGAQMSRQEMAFGAEKPPTQFMDALLPWWALNNKAIIWGALCTAALPVCLPR